MEKKVKKIVEINDLGTAVDVIKRLSGNEFIYYEKDNDAIKAFAKKQLEYGHLLVRYFNDVPAGYICFYSNDSESKVGYITSFVVQDHGLNNGRVAFDLGIKAVDIMARDGMTTVRVQVAHQNVHARKLYEKIGFEYLGVENENGLYMIVDLQSLKKKYKRKDRTNEI